MRRLLAVVAAAIVVGLGAPAWADGRDGQDPSRHDPSHYRHHDRYKGDYYDYPDYHGGRSDDGPYDGYYDCRRSEGPRHSETWCDHYYGYQPEASAHRNLILSGVPSL